MFRRRDISADGSVPVSNIMLNGPLPFSVTCTKSDCARSLKFSRER
jgi:hypothetical protein